MKLTDDDDGDDTVYEVENLKTLTHGKYLHEGFRGTVKEAKIQIQINKSKAPGWVKTFITHPSSFRTPCNSLMYSPIEIPTTALVVPSDHFPP